jgi:hypothetical protein
MLELPAPLLAHLRAAYASREVVCHGTVKLVVAAPVPTAWSDTGVIGELVVLHDRVLDTCFFQVLNGFVVLASTDGVLLHFMT